MRVCVYGYLNWTYTSCLPILSLIRLSNSMNPLTFGCNLEFRKTPYFSKVISASTETIFRRANNEMTNTKKSNEHLYTESEEKQVGGEFMKEKITNVLYYFYQPSIASYRSSSPTSCVCLELL